MGLSLLLVPFFCLGYRSTSLELLYFKSFGQKQCYEYILLGLYVFVQGLQFTYLSVSQSLRGTGVPWPQRRWFYVVTAPQC